MKWLSLIVLVQIYGIMNAVTAALETAHLVAVEGLSANVNILCNLDHETGPLYWRINGLVFDLYSVPEAFEAEGYVGLVIPRVHRGMDGWTFQCFTVADARNSYFNLGELTILTVIYNVAITSPGQGTSVPVLEPSLNGRLLLDYQELELEFENITLKWQYYPDPSVPCVGIKYTVEVYTYSNIMDVLTEGDLQPVYYFDSHEENITLPSDLLMNYFRISALNASNYYCARMEHLTSLSFNGSYKMVYLDESSASFQIPTHLQEMNTLQLIWFKDDATQCVCPPVKEIASCACNREVNNTSNFVTISDGYLTISNLTEELNYVPLHFVTSGLSGCNNKCDIRSITEIYKIVIRGPPSTPEISYDSMNQLLCFNSSFNPDHPPHYEVNITDITGSLTDISGTYNTSRCLMTSDLHPDVCGPLWVSVAARNSFGVSNTSQLISTSNEVNECSCHLEKDGIQVNVSSVTSTTATVTLTCPLEYTRNNVTLVIADQTSIIVLCNTSKEVGSLVPATNYIISWRNSTCPLGSLLTYSGDGQSRSIIVGSVIGGSFFVMVPIIIIMLCVLYWRTKPSVYIYRTYNVVTPKSVELDSVLEHDEADSISYDSSSYL